MSSNAAATDSKNVALLPVEVRCSYPSKLCNNHRAVKDNGDLHKLCDFHRKKANVNQQRMQQKRRLIRQQMVERKKRFLDATQGQAGPMEFNVAAAAAEIMGPDNKPLCDLTPEEVKMLEIMLFDEDENYMSPGEGQGYPADLLQQVDMSAMGSYPSQGNMSL